MRILHVIPGDLWAGAEAQVFYSAEYMQKHTDNEIIVALFNDGELYRRLQSGHISTRLINEQSHNGFAIISELKRIIISSKPDVIHVHEYKSHILTAIANTLSKSLCPVIRTQHGETIVPRGYKYLKSRLIIKLERLFKRRSASALVAVSEDMKAKLEKENRNQKVVHIHNSVRGMANDCQQNIYMRRQHGIGEKTFWVATAARLVAVKNIQMLIETAGRLKEIGAQDVFISVFGDGPQKQDLQRLIDESNLSAYVRLEGRSDDMAAIFNNIDVFALTSSTEGLPISLLEAMHAGAVPVCTAVGGMVEVIESGVNGFLVDLDNVDDMVSAITSLKDDNKLMVKMRENAKTTVVSKYSADVSASKMIDLYKSVLA